MKTRVKELRLRNGLTQSGLALKIGSCQNQISKIELGKADPSCEQAKILSQFFNVSIDYLLCTSNYEKSAEYYIIDNPQKSNLYEYYSKLSIKHQRAIDLIISILGEKHND